MNFNPPRIGFCLRDLSAGQSAYLCIRKCNEAVTRSISTDLAIFFVEQSAACLDSKVPRFHIRDVVRYQGDLVCVSLDTLLAAKSAYTSRLFYYIQDLETTRSNFDQSRLPLYEEVMKDPKIVKFCRCTDHRDYFKNLGYIVDDRVVEDFDIDQILSIIGQREGIK